MNRSAPIPVAGRPIDVTVVVFDGGYCSTAIGPLEVFYSAGLLWNRFRGEPEQPRFKVRSASVDGRQVSSFYGMTLLPQCSIADVQQTDVIILMAVQPDGYHGLVRDSGLVPWLRAAHARGTYIAAICGGAALLAETGLLDGRRATTHWAVADLFRQRYPKVQWQPEHFVTEDAGLFCSGGIYAAMDLSLFLVEKFCGHEIALQCAKSLLISLPRQLQSGYGVLPISRTHGDEPVRRAEEILQRRFDEDVSLDAVASQLGMSPRNLMRRFKAATGHLPGEYQQRLRVSAARELLERGRAPLQKIAEAVGYEDVAFFRSLFKRHTGMTPADYRNRYGPLTVPPGELQAG
jgi:transcriptional regulator GlxA family with amidase domain